MLFTNRNPPVKKSKVKTTGGGGGTLVYQTKVQSHKRTRYSDTVEKQIQRKKPIFINHVITVKNPKNIAQWISETIHTMIYKNLA